MDDQTYLDPEFDPSTLTIPRLRSILVAHNISYASSAKKQQLIDIFNESVKPQARAIRSENARVKRTSKGIEDVGYGRNTPVSHEEEEIQAPRSVRRSTRARTEEAQEVLPTPRSHRHSTAPPEDSTYRRRRPVSDNTNQMIQEEPESRQPSPRKSRVGLATPVAKARPALEADDESPFSSENVFQSGGSPPVSRNINADRRRTTSSAVKDLENRYDNLRRRTEDLRPSNKYFEDTTTPVRNTVASPIRASSRKSTEERSAYSHREDAIVPARTPARTSAPVSGRRTFEIPITAMQNDNVETDEEFTPEEQNELIQAETAGEIVPVKRQPRRAGGHATRGIGAVLITLFSTLAFVWRQEKLEVGYCGVGQPSLQISGVEIPEWAEFIRPQCEPCPPHAFCSDRLETQCETGFVLTQHPLSLAGLVPIPPTCEPDSVRTKKVQQVTERAIQELREQNAKYECGEISSPEIEETSLKRAMATKRRPGLSNEEFEDLWASAIGEIVHADEVKTGSGGTTGRSTLRSTSLAHVPFSCAVRRSLRAAFKQYIWRLVGVLFLLGSGAYGRRRLLGARDTESRAKLLASHALEKLRVQASLHAREPAAYPESFISVSQLRDDVLSDEFSAQRRAQLWAKVQTKVELNSNVRPMVREGRSGDVGRVWEWIGAVGLLEAGASSGSALTSPNAVRSDRPRVSFAATDSPVARSPVPTSRESRPYF